MSEFLEFLLPRHQYDIYPDRIFVPLTKVVEISGSEYEVSVEVLNERLRRLRRYL